MKIISKFGSANSIKIVLYHNYVEVFGGLTIIKKILIACTYLIISIIKLSFCKTGSSTFYYLIKDHIVVLALKPRALLITLSGYSLVSHNMTYITEENNCFHIFNIDSSVIIQRTRVLETLAWLKVKLFFYNNIIMIF